jgi:hypothetical protein
VSVRASPHKLWNARTNLYETWYVYHDNWAHLSGILHKSLPSAWRKDFGVTYKTGSGLDDWIYWHRTHTTRDYRQYSTIADLQTSQFTFTHALGFSIFLATDLQQPHCHFKLHITSSFHRLIPFLPLFCNCQFRRLGSIQFLCSQAHILADWRLETLL